MVFQEWTDTTLGQADHPNCGGFIRDEQGTLIPYYVGTDPDAKVNVYWWNPNYATMTFASEHQSTGHSLKSTDEGLVKPDKNDAPPLVGGLVKSNDDTYIPHVGGDPNYTRKRLLTRDEAAHQQQQCRQGKAARHNTDLDPELFLWKRQADTDSKRENERLEPVSPLISSEGAPGTTPEGAPEGAPEEGAPEGAIDSCKEILKHLKDGLESAEWFDNDLPCKIVRIHETSAEPPLAASIETEEGNSKLTADQKELLRWHFCLGHVGMSHLQWYIRSGKLPVRNPKGVDNCTRPKCAVCEYSKATERATATGTTIPNPENGSKYKWCKVSNDERGLYIYHTDDGHQAWSERKAAREGNTDASSGPTSDTSEMSGTSDQADFAATAGGSDDDFLGIGNLLLSGREWLVGQLIWIWLGVYCTTPFLLTILLLLEREIGSLISFERVLSIFSTRKRRIRATGHRKHRSRFRRTPFMPSLLALPTSRGSFTHTVGLSAWFCAMHHYLTHFIAPTMLVVRTVHGLITTILMGTGTCGLMFAGGCCLIRRKMGGIRGAVGILLDNRGHVCVGVFVPYLRIQTRLKEPPDLRWTILSDYLWESLLDYAGNDPVGLLAQYISPRLLLGGGQQIRMVAVQSKATYPAAIGPHRKEGTGQATPHKHRSDGYFWAHRVLWTWICLCWFLGVSFEREMEHIRANFNPGRKQNSKHEKQVTLKLQRIQDSHMLVAQEGTFFTVGLGIGLGSPLLRRLTGFLNEGSTQWESSFRRSVLASQVHAHSRLLVTFLNHTEAHWTGLFLLMADCHEKGTSVGSTSYWSYWRSLLFYQRSWPRLPPARCIWSVGIYRVHCGRKMVRWACWESVVTLFGTNKVLGDLVGAEACGSVIFGRQVLTGWVFRQFMVAFVGSLHFNPFWGIYSTATFLVDSGFGWICDLDVGPKRQKLINFLVMVAQWVLQHWENLGSSTEMLGCGGTSEPQVTKHMSANSKEHKHMGASSTPTQVSGVVGPGMEMEVGCEVATKVDHGVAMPFCSDIFGHIITAMRQLYNEKDKNVKRGMDARHCVELLGVSGIIVPSEVATAEIDSNIKNYALKHAMRHLCLSGLVETQQEARRPLLDHEFLTACTMIGDALGIAEDCRSLANGDRVSGGRFIKASYVADQIRAIADRPNDVLRKLPIDLDGHHDRILDEGYEEDLNWKAIPLVVVGAEALHVIQATLGSSKRGYKKEAENLPTFFPVQDDKIKEYRKSIKDWSVDSARKHTDNYVDEKRDEEELRTDSECCLLAGQRDETDSEREKEDADPASSVTASEGVADLLLTAPARVDWVTDPASSFTASEEVADLLFTASARVDWAAHFGTHAYEYRAANLGLVLVVTLVTEETWLKADQMWMSYCSTLLICLIGTQCPYWHGGTHYEQVWLWSRLPPDKHEQVWLWPRLPPDKHISWQGKSRVWFRVPPDKYALHHATFWRRWVRLLWHWSLLQAEFSGFGTALHYLMNWSTHFLVSFDSTANLGTNTDLGSDALLEFDVGTSRLTYSAQVSRPAWSECVKVIFMVCAGVWLACGIEFRITLAEEDEEYVYEARQAKRALQRKKNGDTAETRQLSYCGYSRRTSRCEPWRHLGRILLGPLAVVDVVRQLSHPFRFSTGCIFNAANSDNDKASDMSTTLNGPSDLGKPGASTNQETNCNLMLLAANDEKTDISSKVGRYGRFVLNFNTHYGTGITWTRHYSASERENTGAKIASLVASPEGAPDAALEGASTERMPTRQQCKAPKYLAIMDLAKTKIWSVVPRSKAGTESVGVPRSTWSYQYRCKSLPNGAFRKYKARACLKGAMQNIEGGGDVDTYGPMVSWITVRLMLIVSLMVRLGKFVTIADSCVEDGSKKETNYLGPLNLEVTERNEISCRA